MSCLFPGVGAVGGGGLRPVDLGPTCERPGNTGEGPWSWALAGLVMRGRADDADALGAPSRALELL